MAQRVAEQDGADLGAAEGQTQVSAGALMNGIHREAARHRGRLGQAFVIELRSHFDAFLSADPAAEATPSRPLPK
jgi:hypothetical protein